MNTASRWLNRAPLAVLTPACSWYGMMLVHELGHALHAAVSGGEVERIVWTPLGFSRTEVGHNPAPAFSRGAAALAVVNLA